MSFWSRILGPDQVPQICPTCTILRAEHTRRENSLMEAAERREAALLRQIEDSRTQLAAIADRAAAATASNIQARKSEEPKEKSQFFRLPPMPQSMAGHTSMARFRDAAKPQDKRRDLPPPA